MIYVNIWYKMLLLQRLLLTSYSWYRELQVANVKHFLRNHRCIIIPQKFAFSRWTEKELVNSTALNNLQAAKARRKE